MDVYILSELTNVPEGEIRNIHGVFTTLEAAMQRGAELGETPVEQMWNPQASDVVFSIITDKGGTYYEISKHELAGDVLKVEDLKAVVSMADLCYELIDEKLDRLRIMESGFKEYRKLCEDIRSLASESR